MTRAALFISKPMMRRPFSSISWGTNRKVVNLQQVRYHHHYFLKSFDSSSEKRWNYHPPTSKTTRALSETRKSHYHQRRLLFSSSSPSPALGVSLLQELSFRIQQQKQQHSHHKAPPPPIPSTTTTTTNSDTWTTKKIASNFCIHYQSLPAIHLSSQKEEGKEREEILNYLIEECNIDFQSMTDLLQSHNNTNTEEEREHGVPFYAKIREACKPVYEDIFTLLSSSSSQSGSDDHSIGIKCILAIRQDLKIWGMKLKQLSHLHDASSKESKTDEIGEEIGMKKKQKIKQMDTDMKRMLSVWFSSGMLELRRITYDTTPASIIEQIALKEAVHPLRSLDDLRTRLGRNRRCYAFFHPSFLVNEPLVFVHVALMQDIPRSMEDINNFTSSAFSNEAETAKECKEKRVAVFYSITSTQSGLSGVDLGNFLIKRVVDVLKRDFPKMETFVTLSPLPRFRKWVEGKLQQQQKIHTDNYDGDCVGTASKFVDDTFFTEEELYQLRNVLQCSSVEGVSAALLESLEKPLWHENQDLSSTLKPILLKLAARYLLKEKHRGKPLDGVAKFHTRNGAEMYQLNYLADKSRKGMHNSFGIMLNYRYCLEPEGVLEENQLRYEREGWIEVREGVSQWLDTSCVGDGDNKDM